MQYNNLLSYCDTTGGIIGAQWYHFAFVFKLYPDSVLECYLDGVSYSPGTNPIIIATSSMPTLSELVIGGTNSPSVSETVLKGMVSEVRLWSDLRSEFEIYSFRYHIWEHTYPADLIYSFRLNETSNGTDTQIREQVSGNLIDPTG